MCFPLMFRFLRMVVQEDRLVRTNLFEFSFFVFVVFVVFVVLQFFDVNSMT